MEPSPPVKLLLGSMYTVGFIDSAGGRVTPNGRGKNQRSRSAIVVISRDDLNRIFIRKAWARHCTTDELCDEIFRTQKDFPTIAVLGIDASANQSLFADALIREAREKGKKLPLTKIPLPNDKIYRIETTVQPAQSSGRLFAMEEMLDLQGEYQAFPGSTFNDILDALAGAIKLLPLKANVDEMRNEVEQYRTYLQSTRMPADQIEARVQEAFGLAQS